jgi:CRISPR-associated protein Cas2
MYIIAVYDVASERCGKMLRLCRKYLHWVQNSVFEGEMTEVALKEFLIEAKKIMVESYDSLILFKNRNANWLEKQVIGKERSSVDQFL